MPNTPDENVFRRAAELEWRPTDMDGVDWKPLRYVAETGAGASEGEFFSINSKSCWISFSSPRQRSQKTVAGT